MVDPAKQTKTNNTKKRPRTTPTTTTTPAAAAAADATDVTTTILTTNNNNNNSHHEEEEEGQQRTRSPTREQQRQRSSSSSRRKRKRQKRQQRPTPPGEPPESLVHLLQTDSSVLKYFQSLQQSLNYDVQIWKDRANEWKQKYNNKNIEEKNNDVSKDNNNSKKKKKRNSSSSTKKKSGAAGVETAAGDRANKAAAALDISADGGTTATAGAGDGGVVGESILELQQQPIDDSMFELEFSSSSSSDEDEDDVGVDEDFVDGGNSSTQNRRRTGKNIQQLRTTTALNDEEEENDRRNKMKILKFLQEAYEALERLGIPLVEVTTVEEDEKKEEDGGKKDCCDDVAAASYSTRADDDDDGGGGGGDENKDLLVNDGGCDSSNNNKVVGKSVPTTTTATRHLRTRRRRTNQEVAGSIISMIHNVTRIQQQLKNQLVIDDDDDKVVGLEHYYAPFTLLPSFRKFRQEGGGGGGGGDVGETNEGYDDNIQGGGEPQPPMLLLLPVCDDNDNNEDEECGSSNNDDASSNNKIRQQLPRHPIIESTRLLYRALVILDTFCCYGRDDGNDEWNSLFDSCEMMNNNSMMMTKKIQEMIRVGLRGRKDMVSDLLNSLHGEIISNNSANGDRNRSLSTLLERYWISQTIIMTYLSRNDYKSAYDLVIQYVISSVPSIATMTKTITITTTTTTTTDIDEDVQLQPPAMSLVILRGMLRPPSYCSVPVSATLNNNATTNSVSWLVQYLRSIEELKGDDNSAAELSCFCQVLSLCIHHTANIWKKLASGDANTNTDNTDSNATAASSNPDIASVEIDSYKDLLLSESEWMMRKTTTNNIDSTKEEQDSTLTQLQTIEEKILNSITDDSSDNLWILSESMKLNLILRGDIQRIKSMMMKMMNNDNGNSNKRRALTMIKSAAYAYKQVIIRNYDQYSKGVGRLIAAGDQEVDCPSSLLLSLLASLKNNIETETAATTIIDRWVMMTSGIGGSNSDNNTDQECVGHYENAAATILDIAEILSDGKAVSKVFCAILLRQQQSKDNCSNDCNSSFLSMKCLYDAIQKVGKTPLIRVINLKKRTDRMNMFMSQALREQILVVLGCCCDNNADANSDAGDNGDYYYGRYAYDGCTGRMAEIDQRLSSPYYDVSSQQQKDNARIMINPYWYPHNLKAFDRNAPDEKPNSVATKMSYSEIACAMSHISCWQGVQRTFQLLLDKEADEKCSYNGSTTSNTANAKKLRLFRNPQSLRRLFQLSGFAQGPPLLAGLEEGSMPPTPACIVLEDDAILVDRFRDRLQELLQHLPRDFHFCSLGYGRPKNAPIFPYNKVVGIPSHLFYMTGYILSPAGVQYLLDKNTLPVNGPIDSWIGHMMTNNWDNVYGTTLGVGIRCKPPENVDKIISRKDLSLILKFRAYCAMHPLCSQRVGTTSWRSRDRDTDIIYSGV